jgi:methionyl-tRNA synthetase
VPDHDWPSNIIEALDSLPENGVFEVPEVMFRKITDEERDEWKNQFSGN